MKKQIDPNIIFRKEKIWEESVEKWINNKDLTTDQKLIKIRILNSRLMKVSDSKKEKPRSLLKRMLRIK